jgi:hypothetical protein
MQLIMKSIAFIIFFSLTKFFKLSIPNIYLKMEKLMVQLVSNQYQRLPGACNRSPGSKLLSITTQLHCGGHLGGRVQLPDTILEEDHPMTIPSKFGSNCATGSRQDGFYVNFP